MFVFRGVNIYPSSVDLILSNVPGLGSEYQIHLSRDRSGRDLMRLVAERGEGVEDARGVELGNEVVYRIKKELLVTPEAEIVAYGSLPRSERKSQRVFDARMEEG